MPLAKTLSSIIGSLDNYEAENEDPIWPDLPSYIEEELNIYLDNEHQRKRQEQLKKKFSDLLLNYRCSECDAPYETMLLFDSGTIHCKCESRYILPLCTGCESELDFDKVKEVWSCSKCGITFERPRLRLSDFKFMREPTRN